MADRLFLSNDANDGSTPHEARFDFGAANTVSAEAGNATTSSIIVGPMSQNGRIVEFAIAVVEPALSASGFISGNVSANLFVLNAASGAISALDTTLPSIAGPVANSAAVVMKATNAGGGTSGVLHATGANFSAGDYIFYNRTVQSAASAAPGNTAVKGFRGYIKVRYNAS